MSKKFGAFGSCIRLILVTFNIILFIIGAVVFASAAIIRWKPELIVSELIDDQDINSIINISSLGTVSLALLAIGGAMLLLGVIGLIGTMCSSRFFLVLYEVLIIMIFFCHGVLLLLVSYKSSDLEEEFRKELNKSIEIINSPNSSEVNFNGQCDIMRALSSVFDCCGANGSQDFLNKTLIGKCCHTDQQFAGIGCADKTVDTIKTNGINIVLIPNSILLGIELLFILTIPMLISKIKRQDKYMDRQVNYLRPTSEFRKSYGTHPGY